MKSEQKIKFSNENYIGLVEALFKNSNDVIAFVSIDLKIKRLSSSFKKMTGYSSSQFIEKSALSLPIFSAKSKLVISKHVAISLKTKKTQFYEVEFIKKK